MDRKILVIFFALLAAVLYAINIPFSKILLRNIEPIYMTSCLYFGAGVGISIFSKFLADKNNVEKLSKKELPFTIGMIVLDIVAPICLMMGLNKVTSANASLLNNFEIVATSLIALFVFKEMISSKMWVAIYLITCSSILLSFEGVKSLQFSSGSIYIIFACVCWGVENNCTRMLSSKSTTQIVALKGFFSGLGSLIVAIIVKEQIPQGVLIFYALILGFLSYGLSIFFYIRAQRELGAAKTSAYYAISPFIGVLLSFVILKEPISKKYLVALVVMIIGTIFVILDTLMIKHSHLHTHTVVHRHDGSTYEYIIEHDHKHGHFVNKAAKHNHKYF